MIANAIELKKLKEQLNKKEKDVRFCNAYALTMIGRDALNMTKENVKKQFNLRNSYTIRGFSFKRAEKTDEFPQAQIKIERWYIADRDIETRIRKESWYPNRSGFFALGVPFVAQIPTAYSALKLESGKTSLPYSGTSRAKARHKTFVFNKFGREAIAYRPDRSKLIVLYSKVKVRTRAVHYFQEPINDKFINEFSIYYQEAWDRWVDK